MKNLLKACVFLFVFAMIGLSTTSAQSYSKAVGLRYTGWGTGLTAKMFISENAAVEAGVNYRSWGGTYGYSRLHVFGLYEIHNDLDWIDGLQWYYGGGAYIVNYGGEYNYFWNDRSSFGFGISGVLGLEYKFDNLPISISSDWMPGFGFGGWGGTYGGGFAIRYTF